VLPAVWWGWRGDFLAVAMVCLLLAGTTAAVLSRRPPPGVARLGYLAAFRRVGAAPGAVAMLVGSTARAGLWMAWLAYLAAFLAERFGASPALLAGVWTLGGSTFFLANQVAGRLANRQAAGSGRGWRTPERLLGASLLAASVTAPALYVAPSLLTALLLTVAQAVAQGVALAGFVSLFIRRYPAVRGAVMGLNAAGFNLGTFAGVGLAGVGLGVAGYPGLAAVLALLGLLAFGTAAGAVRRPAPREG
jgi:predicted MFS family arabinose efflux permease